MAHYGFTKEGKELKTQWETILYYVREEGKRITQWQAIEQFGFTDLAGIVKKIEYRTGIVLRRRKFSVGTRYGATTFVTQYWYEENR